MLQHTVQLCTGAFARSPTAISTTIKPLTHLALASKTPFPPAASIWVPTAHVAGLYTNLRAAQISAVGDAADLSYVALLHAQLSPCCWWQLHITYPSVWLLYQFSSPAASLWVAVSLRQFDN